MFPTQRADTRVPWTAETYPQPDMRLAPDPSRAMAPTTAKLFWRESGALAYRVGLDHPVDEEPQLVTWEELMAPPPPPPPPPKRRGRPRKNPDDPKWAAG